MKSNNLVRLKSTNALCIYAIQRSKFPTKHLIIPVFPDVSDKVLSVNIDSIEFICDYKELKEKCLSCEYKFYCFTT